MTEEQDLQQAFSHLLLLGNFLASPGDAAQKRINEIFDLYGFSIICSAYEVVDKSRIGDSTVIIARYSVECCKKERERGRPFVIEGAIALEENPRIRSAGALPAAML